MQDETYRSPRFNPASRSRTANAVVSVASWSYVSVFATRPPSTPDERNENATFFGVFFTFSLSRSSNSTGNSSAVAVAVAVILVAVLEGVLALTTNARMKIVSVFVDRRLCLNDVQIYTPVRSELNGTISRYASIDINKNNVKRKNMYHTVTSNP